MQVPAAAGPAGRLMAWLGGGAFVASLATFGWCYAVRFGVTNASGDGTGTALAWNLGLFSTFALHHSVMARSGAKRWLARHLPPRLERSLYVWIASALFALTCLRWQEIPVVLYSATGGWMYACFGVQLLGVWLTIRAAGIIDVLDLAGIRQAEGRTRPAVFQVIGPYHLVRHPIYLGWALMTFGTPAMTGTRLAFAAISTCYLAAAIPFEERSLVEEFGDEYRAYQRRVRWRMIPGVY